MSFFSGRNAALNRRLKKVQKELSTVDRDLRALSRSVERQVHSAEEARSSRLTVDRLAKHDSAAVNADAHPGQQVVDSPKRRETDTAAHPRDERLADYLVESFQSMRPLRNERRIQRNKALVMCIVALLVLFWALYRMFA